MTTFKTKANTKHKKIHTWLMDQISSGAIKVGDQLPTEKSIMEEFGVNRTTVRTALNKLEKAEMIMRRSGKGTFLIADTPPKFVRTFNRIEVVPHDAVSGNTDFQTIEKIFVVPPRNVELILSPKSDELLSFTRVISVDGEPSLVEKTYLNDTLSEVFMDLDTNQPYYPLITKYTKEKLSHVKISFTAKHPEPWQQELLNIDAHHPCIVMQSQLYNTEYQVLEVLESTYRGDKYLFTMESLGFNLNES